MTQPMTKRNYVPPAQVTRIVLAARAAGVSVGAVEVSPNGTIRVSEAPRAIKSDDVFEAWQDRL